MSSIVDSKAYFAARVNILGLGEHLETFRLQNWNTIAELAFATHEDGCAAADDGAFGAASRGRSKPP